MDTIEKIFDDAWMNMSDGHDIPYKDFQTPPKYGVFDRKSVPAQSVDGALMPPGVPAQGYDSMQPTAPQLQPQQQQQQLQQKPVSVSALTEAQKDALLAKYAKELERKKEKKRMQKMINFTYDVERRRADTEDDDTLTKDMQSYRRLRNSFGQPKQVGWPRARFMVPKFQDPYAFANDVAMQHVPQQLSREPSLAPAYPTYSTAHPLQYPQWALGQATTQEDDDTTVVNTIWYLALGALALYAVDRWGSKAKPRRK